MLTVLRPLLPLPAVLVTLLLLGAGCGGDAADGGAEAPLPAEAPAARAGAPAPGPDPKVHGGPGRVEPDRFHPDHLPGSDGVRPPLPPPRRGGRVVVHLSTLPGHFNYMTDSSAVTRFTLREVHESLVERDWSTWEYAGRLAESWTVEDAVRLHAEEGEEEGELLFGRTSEEKDVLVIEPASPGNPLVGLRRVPRERVARVDPGTVFTFRLHDGVLWHDGHPLDADDVVFSWRCYRNPHVACDDLRAQVGRIVDAEALDRRTVRFRYDAPYFLALDSFEKLTVLPAHIYDLADPDHPEHDPGVDPLGPVQGRHVNEHPANRGWVGLGPWRIVRADNEGVLARRFDGYWDEARAGWVDEILWYHVPDDDAALVALRNGELDHFGRLRSEDYLGEFCRSPEFTERLYAGHHWTPRVTYVAWNMRRPLFSDVRVRTALGHAFDWDAYVAGPANGLGVRITGTAFYLGPNYDHSITPLPFDLERAAELLDEAGWYDRDGDGVRDRDGQAFSFEYLVLPGNKPQLEQAQLLQENLGRIGVELSVATRDWGAYMERVRGKEFDSYGLSWALDVESDPAFLWRSYDGPPGEDRTRNYPGVDDPEVDRLIEAIRTELDAGRRAVLHHALQRRVYELQPYMFGYLVPVKFCVSRRVRNFRAYSINPGYSIRDWYLVE